MSKSKLDNTETNMVAFEGGYILTQVELCNKLPPIEKEFKKLVQDRKREAERVYATFHL